MANTNNNGFAEKFFKLKQNNTNVKTEIIAGFTTFMTMAYILAVNPQILGEAGMPSNGVFVATALSAFIGTMIMALLANYPFALAPGMGLNAFFTYTVVIQYGYSWETALAAVFIEGIIFLVLTFFNVREALFNAIPQNLKLAVSAGIGLFIAFIGLQGSGIVIGSPATKVMIGDLTSPTACLALVGVFIIAILYIKKVKGALLIGILVTYVLGIIAQLTGWYTINPEIGHFNLLPQGKFLGIFGTPSGLEDVAFKLDFKGIFSPQFFTIIFAFLFVDLFDTLGTLIGVSSKANMLDKNGKLPKIKQALFADSVATTAGALLGTSTTTTFVESASGVVEGGRTGLTAIITAVLFLVALVLSPLFLAIPGFATAPALIFVGFLMLESIAKVNFDDFSEAIPAFLTLLMMPLAYSISEGISFGVISYTLINTFTGKSKKVSAIMWILTILFIAKYIFLPH